MALTNGGTPTSQNYEIGRGKLLLDVFESGAATGSFVDRGNCSAFALSMEENTLDHTSSLEGLATKDVTVTLDKSIKGSFTLEEITKENLQIFFSADMGTVVQTATDITDGLLTISAQAVGKWFKLYDGAANLLDRTAPNLPVFDITSPVLTDNAGSTTYVLGTDYEIDLKFGLIRLLTTGALSGGLTAGKLDFAKDAKTYDKVRMLNVTTVNARLQFLGEDAYTGKKKLLFLNKVKLIASGDAAQISDEWSQVTLEFTVEKDVTYDSASPYGYIIPLS
jgi:hypothetical protein